MHQPALDNSARAWAEELARTAWRLLVALCIVINTVHTVVTGRKRHRRPLPSIRPP